MSLCIVTVEREETEIYAEFVLAAGREGCEEVEAGAARRHRDV
jgi:hypothetical protein